MCQLCEDNNGDYQSCVDCSRLICFDEQSEDDVVARAYVTESGDLYCTKCGKEHDHAADEDDSEDAYYEAPPEEDEPPLREDTEQIGH